jgi:hypothetical protein
MTPGTINGTQYLQQLLSFQLFNQTGPAFPVFNQSFNIVSSTTPGVIQISTPEGVFVTSRAVIDFDVGASDGLYNYVVFTDGPSFSVITVVTRFVPSPQQVARLSSFLSSNGFFGNIRDVSRPDDCQYAGGITPNVLPAPTPDATAPNNRIAIIVGSVVGSVAFLAIAVGSYVCSICTKFDNYHI